MRLTGVQAYTQSVGIKPASGLQKQPVNPLSGNISQTFQARLGSQSQTLTPQSVLSPAEKQFFGQLFPQTTRQFSNDTVFTLQGKIQTPQALYTGRVFDGRA